jgi:hypothetical protein
MNRIVTLVAWSLTVAAVSAKADTVSIEATGRGWVCTESSGSYCPGNNGADPDNNYFAGTNFDNSKYRDWFEFAIPTLTGESILSATLNLDDPGSFLFPGVTYSYAVYGLSGQPMVFDDVAASDPFGSVDTNGGYETTTLSITLNAAALAAIAADEGGYIFIGGIDSAELGPPGELAGPVGVGDFGDTGRPLVYNTALTLSTAPSSVPEPKLGLTLGIFLVGLIVVQVVRSESQRRE